MKGEDQEELPGAACLRSHRVARTDPSETVPTVFPLTPPWLQSIRRSAPVRQSTQSGHGDDSVPFRIWSRSPPISETLPPPLRPKRGRSSGSCNSRKTPQNLHS